MPAMTLASRVFGNRVKSLAGHGTMDAAPTAPEEITRNEEYYSGLTDQMQRPARLLLMVIITYFRYSLSEGALDDNRKVRRLTIHHLVTIDGYTRLTLACLASWQLAFLYPLLRL
jgi:hypothetical protein